MTGLTFKNCDIFHRRVCIYLSSIGLGLSGFLTVGCTQIPPHSFSNPTVTSSNVISDASSKTPKEIKNVDKAQYLPISARAKLGDRIINLEVALTPTQQSKGLMFRSTLADDRGMLFIFNPPMAIGFWMKNVPVPLDMVFTFEGKIVAIAASVPPCKTNPCPIYPSTPVVTDQVIELRAGLTKEMGLKLGDSVTIEKL